MRGSVPWDESQAIIEAAINEAKAKGEKSVNVKVVYWPQNQQWLDANGYTYVDDEEIPGPSLNITFPEEPKPEKKGKSKK